MAFRVITWCSDLAKAAESLFATSGHDFDLRWPDSTWKLLPHELDEEYTERQYAESLVTLCALKLLKAEFSRRALDDSEDSPLSSLTEVPNALNTVLFHLGQMFAEEPEYEDDGSVDLQHVLRELALERLVLITPILLQHFPSVDERLVFFAGRTDDDDSIAIINEDLARTWVYEGCPIECSLGACPTYVHTKVGRIIAPYSRGEPPRTYVGALEPTGPRPIEANESRCGLGKDRWRGGP